MHPATAPLTPLTALIQSLRSWPQTSQERARRNAMVAATACAQRRVERQQVDDYFASLTAVPATDSAPAQAK